MVAMSHREGPKMASKPKLPNANPQIALAQDTDGTTNVELPDLPESSTTPAKKVIRNVDLYNFTDEQGNQWMLEGLRENVVRPAVYTEGL